MKHVFHSQFVASTKELKLNSKDLYVFAKMAPHTINQSVITAFGVTTLVISALKTLKLKFDHARKVTRAWPPLINDSLQILMTGLNSYKLFVFLA